MIKLYSEKKVRKLLARIQEEYDEILQKQRAFSEALREENRALNAKLLQLEGEREQVLAALTGAVKAGEQIKKEGEAELERKRLELDLLLQSARELLEQNKSASVKNEERQAVYSFQSAVKKELGEEEECGLNMEEVLSPKHPLDLEKLCKELGVMEEE